MNNDYSHIQGDMKRFDNLFPESRIGDFNTEGFDSVDSEDFDPGFGCVPLKKIRAVPLPPEITARQIQSDIDNQRYFFETTEQSEAKQKSYLQKHGINF